MTFAIIYIVFLFMLHTFDASVNEKNDITQQDRKIYKTYHIAFIIFLTFAFAFRTEKVGQDTASYMRSFEVIKYRTYSEIFSVDSSRKEYLFYIVTKIIATFTDNTAIFFGIFGALFAFSFGNVVHKHSDNYFMSYVIFLALYFSFFIAGMRQVAAISILLFSYEFIRQRRLVPFLLCIAVAYYFHNTAIIFILAYPMATMRWGKGQLIILATCIVLAYVLPETFLKIVFDWFNWERLESYEARDITLSSSGFIIKLCILAFNVYHYNVTIEKKKSNAMLYNLAILGTGFQAFTVAIAEAFRISVYFSIFDTILTANVIEALSVDTYMNQKNKTFLRFIIVFLFIVYYLFVASPVDYELSIFK